MIFSVPRLGSFFCSEKFLQGEIPRPLTASMTIGSGPTVYLEPREPHSLSSPGSCVVCCAADCSRISSQATSEVDSRAMYRSYGYAVIHNILSFGEHKSSGG